MKYELTEQELIQIKEIMWEYLMDQRIALVKMDPQYPEDIREQEERIKIAHNLFQKLYRFL